MALSKEGMTDEQRKSVALEYLKAFDNGGVTSTGGSIMDLFADDAQVYIPKWGLAEGVERLGASRVLIVTDPMTKPVADELAEHLGGRFAAVFSDVQQHVPIEAVRQAREVAERSGADCVVTVGGGSTTGFGKAIALHTGIPTIAVPTTYAGSEMTPIYGITSDGLKRTDRDLKVLPRTVIYDPALT